MIELRSPERRQGSGDADGGTSDCHDEGRVDDRTAHFERGGQNDIARRPGPRKRLVLAQAPKDVLAYLFKNRHRLIDYGVRYRAGLPISTSLAESAVESVIGDRFKKNRKMRWTPIRIRTFGMRWIWHLVSTFCPGFFRLFSLPFFL